MDSSGDVGPGAGISSVYSGFQMYGDTADVQNGPLFLWNCTEFDGEVVKTQTWPLRVTDPLLA